MRKEGGRDGGKEGGRDGGKEGGREGGKEGGSACKFCGRRQTLLHVLNNCPKALNSCWYNEQHDAVLDVISKFMAKSLVCFFGSDIGPPVAGGLAGVVDPPRRAG